MMKEELEKRLHDFTKLIYEQGFKDGEAKGLNDAWECMRKILLSPAEGGIHAGDLYKMFSTQMAIEILETVSVDEAMQKIKEYEERQKIENFAKKKDIREEYEKYYMPIGEENMRRKREQREQAEKCEDCTKGISTECVVDGCEFEPKQADVTDSDEIKVGDEVVFCDSFHGARYVVVRIRDNGTFDALCDCGTDDGLDLKKCHKTGRQFPQIAEILRQLRGDKE